MLFVFSAFPSAATGAFFSGKFTAWIAPVGHSATHLRQDLHLLKSMYAKLFSTVIASKGQVLAHLPQPIQAAEQFLRATAPFSLLLQLTNTRRLFLPLLRHSSTPLGQALTQALQPTHFSSSTSGRPVSGLMWIASKPQALTQSPQPKQPNGQPFSPVKTVLANAQV